MNRRACVALAVVACFACGDSSQDRGAPLDAVPTRKPDRVTRTPDQQASDGQRSGEVQTKLESCGLRATDAPDLGNVIADSYDLCIARCALEVACEALVATECDKSRDNAYSACRRACPDAPADGVACRDGTRIPHIALCDGEEDCRQGEDELDCTLSCADGHEVEGVLLECDGTRDCADGSDENNCLICPATTES